MEYKYEALDAKANDIKSTIEANSMQEAISAIRNKGLFPTKVREVDTGVEMPKRVKIVKIAKQTLTLPNWMVPRTTGAKIAVMVFSLLLIAITALIMKIINIG